MNTFISTDINAKITGNVILTPLNVQINNANLVIRQPSCFLFMYHFSLG